jgi:L-serine dehydratase
MESIRTLYKIGNGPSSSHTIGPRNAAFQVKEQFPTASRFVVKLYSSLAATGKGHLTDRAISEALSPIPVEFEWLANENLPFHPNAMTFTAFSAQSEIIGEQTLYSVGGGRLSDGTPTQESIVHVYPHSNMLGILSWAKTNGRTLWEYVYECEGDSIWDFLREIWAVMSQAVELGIEEEGTLPGPLQLARKASSYYVKANSYSGTLRRRALAFAFALAVAEENAAGGRIVTSPTCGSCGVLPSILYLLQHFFDFSEKRILRALATAALFGNVVRENASISGAEVGCQGEIGTACAMAAAAAAQVFGGTPSQVEYAAEMGLEHHLGLTCDPICGLVQVPCIERNAFAAGRALDASTFAIMSDGRHIVPFDKIVNTMKLTGHDIPQIYRETSEGGLAFVME